MTFDCALYEKAKTELATSLASLLESCYGLSEDAAKAAVIKSRDAALDKYRDNPEETKKRG